VAQVLTASPGVSRAAVNLITETAAVEFDAAPGADSSATVAEFTAAVAAKGFTMSLRPVGRAAEEAALQAEVKRAEDLEKTKWDLYKAWGLTGLCLVGGY
jgi:Cu+-exporting ATPase